MILLNLAARQHNDFAQSLFDAHRGLLGWSVFSKTADALDDLACPVSIPDDPIERLIRTFDIGRLACKPAPAGIPTARQPRQWLVKLMRDGSG